MINYKYLPVRSSKIFTGERFDFLYIFLNFIFSNKIILLKNDWKLIYMLEILRLDNKYVGY